jgi:hypothetical protein
VTIIKELIAFIIEMANQVISFLNLFGAGIQKINNIRGTAFGGMGTAGGAGGGFATGGTPSAISRGGIGGSTAGGGAGGSGGVAGGSGSGSGAGTGGGGGSGASAGITGATSLNNLVQRLTGISDQFTELQFLVDTGGISKKAGLSELNKLTKEFNVLEAQANALTARAATGGGAGRTDSATSVTVNFNGVVGDGESVKRNILELFNDSEARGTLGAAAFAGL